MQKRVIERYSQSQELLAAYKAAQLGTKYPVLLDVHTRFFDEWERATMPGMNYWDEIVYRSGTNTSAPVNYVKLWKDDKRIFYHEFIKNFRSEIGRWAAFRKPEFLARLEEPDYLTRMIHWDVKLALDKFTEADRKALTADQRIKILRLLTRSELVGGTYEAPEAFQLLPVPIEFSLKGNELVALDIIESTPPEQRRYILDRLIDVQVGREKDDRRMLLPALCQDFDGQEFERFIINISAWVEQNVPKPENPERYFFEALQKGLAFPLHPGLWDGAPVSKSFSNDGKKVLLHTTDTKVVGWEDVYVGGPDGYMFHEITETTEYNVTASPYEYIVVQFKENFQLSDSKIFRKNERVLMPAIFGYMIFNRMNAKRLQRAGKFGVDIALVALGGAGLVAEWGTLSSVMKVKGIFDLGIGVGSIAVYQGELDTRLKDSEDGKKFLALWEKIQIYSNLADAVEIIANLHALADALDDAGRNPSLSDHDRRTTHNIVESLEHNVPNLPSTTPAPAAKYARLEDRLKGLSATERAEFDKMFAEKSTHLERFDAKPGLVDGWLVIKDDSKFTKWLLSGATDKEFADVERIANYIQKNPHLRASVAEEFAALGKDAKVAWAIRLEEFQELTKIEEKAGYHKAGAPGRVPECLRR